MMISGPNHSQSNSPSTQGLTSGLEFNPKEVLARMMGKQEKEVGQKAYRHFQNGEYTAVLKELTPLSKRWPVDARLSHNIAVTEYIKNGLTMTGTFCEELSRAAEQAKGNINDLSTLEDIDQCPYFFNKAIIFIHLRKYDLALKYLKVINNMSSPLDEPLGKAAAIALVEVYLLTFQPHRALEEILRIENCLSNSNSKSSTPDSNKEDDLKKDEQRMSAKQINDYKNSLAIYKVRCYLGLKSIKSCKRELKNLANIGKVPTSMFLLRCNFEYLKRNELKALKILNGEKSSWKITDFGVHHPTIFYNNSAVLHFSINKPNVALHYLNNAAKEDKKATEEYNPINKESESNGRPVNCLNISVKHIINYNTGIALLFANKSELAFEYLLQSTEIFPRNPRLWLRLAQSCVQLQQAKEELHDPGRPVAKVIGRGIHRKLILNKGNWQSETAKISLNDGSEVPCLEFATQCLRIALSLLPKNLPNKSNINDFKDEDITLLAPPATPLRFYEVLHVKNEILVTSAYVHLSLNNYLIAKEHAELLLAQAYLSPAQEFAGKMYFAEALVHTDYVVDAITYLVADDAMNVSTVPPVPSDAEISPPSPTTWPQLEDAKTAKGLMTYNLAATLAIRGDYTKALSSLETAEKELGRRAPAQISYLRLYLLLMDGRRQEAVDYVSKNFGQIGL